MGNEVPGSIESHHNLPPILFYSTDFPDGSVGKESACSAGDAGSIPESRRAPGEGNSNPLQHFFLENSMERGA